MDEKNVEVPTAITVTVNQKELEGSWNRDEIYCDMTPGEQAYKDAFVAFVSRKLRTRKNKQISCCTRVYFTDFFNGPKPPFDRDIRVFSGENKKMREILVRIFKDENWTDVTFNRASWCNGSHDYILLTKDCQCMGFCSKSEEIF